MKSAMTATHAHPQGPLTEDKAGFLAIVAVRVLATILIACSTIQWLEAQSLVKGQVLSQSGKPVENAEVCRFWVLGGAESDGARAYGSVRSDPAGKFALPVDPKDLPVSLMLFTDDRSAAAVVYAESSTTPLTIRLEPTSRVHIRASAAGLGSELHAVRFILQAKNGATLGQLTSSDVSFPLPSGAYQLSLSSADTISSTRLLSFIAPAPVSLNIALPLGPMAQHYGKKPPSLWPC